MSSKVPFELMPIDEESVNNDSLSRPSTSYSYPPIDAKYSSLPSDNIPTNSDSDPVQRFAHLGLEITSGIISNVIAHPCIVLRRQCQVNRKASRYHLSPLTFIPVVIRLQNRQGLICLWKGCSSIFILRGCSAALETFIAEITPLPREVKSRISLKQLSQHLLLKLITYGILTPFYCSSLVETVQSDIASEKPGVLDCLKEGLCRLFKWGTPRSTRLFPMWQLVGPTALHGCSVYILSSLIHSLLRWMRSVKDKPTLGMEGADFLTNQSATSAYLENLSMLHLSSFIASTILYPGETILHRLYLQGTRTIIDDLDTGAAVLPVISKYEGVSDCFHTIINEEGAFGLYKGFGALLLEFALQAFILKVAQISFRELESLLRPSVPRR
ncbi:mitochondrial outer membrane protein SLC25A46 [Parasteatoda tepidariorum]|uniref:mitochondrial outer membrane protein SLC25A46 n=1 Tax=Parasteatoda tepidariorum TaxID=114398 RepID=UPI00077FE406|nr:solute carrier family 25 member 46 [Parasteatoda tepidariorum]